MNKLIDKSKVRNSFQDELKIISAIGDGKTKCRCGHTQLVPRVKYYEFVLCTWCNGRLYADPIKQKEYEKKRDKEEFITYMKNYISCNTEGVILKYD